jgi:hypothetical protein
MHFSLACVGDCSEGRLQNIYSSIGERETDRLVSDLCTEEGCVTEAMHGSWRAEPVSTEANGLDLVLCTSSSQMFLPSATAEILGK